MPDLCGFFLTAPSRRARYLAFRSQPGEAVPAAVAQSLPGRSGVDIVFILVIAGLYAVSHWVAWAISRLGGLE
jgi:hypothetical protein